MDRSNITEREIMEFDLSLLRNCDIVIVNLDYPDSIGSAIEMYEASQRHIPVIGFGGLDVEVHPWIELCLTKRCKTMLDAVEYVIEFYLPNL
jgi:nucleoside 2-deoxyribosyltransferase